VSCIVLELGLDSFLPRDLPDTFQPDTRLRWVRSLVRTPHFWHDVIDSLPAVQNHPDWSAAARTEESDEQFHELLGADADGLGTVLLAGCYRALAARLEEQSSGLLALDHDGHIPHVDPLIAACTNIVGIDRVDGFGVRPAAPIRFCEGDLRIIHDVADGSVVSGKVDQPVEHVPRGGSSVRPVWGVEPRSNCSQPSAAEPNDTAPCHMVRYMLCDPGSPRP
jgi:hypothetical protein